LQQQLHRCCSRRENKLLAIRGEKSNPERCARAEAQGPGVKNLLDVDSDMKASSDNASFPIQLRDEM